MQRTESPENILDFLARRHRPSAHACGQAGTDLLLATLCAGKPQRILEIGFGTGHTLVETAVRLPRARLFGIEKSPLMLAVAQKRLRFCGIRNISLALLPPDASLPFHDDFFDTVAVESVLAIQAEKEQISHAFAEIFRVLRPGGLFLNNESLWLEHVSPQTIREINGICQAAFGILQATEHWPHPGDWQALARQTGFENELLTRLGVMPIHRGRQWHPALWRSGLFSGWGKIAEYLPGRARRRSLAYRAVMQRIETYGNFLEGILFGFRKPGVTAE